MIHNLREFSRKKKKKEECRITKEIKVINERFRIIRQARSQRDIEIYIYIYIYNSI